MGDSCNALGGKYGGGVFAWCSSPWPVTDPQKSPLIRARRRRADCFPSSSTYFRLKAPLSRNSLCIRQSSVVKQIFEDQVIMKKIRF